MSVVEPRDFQLDSRFEETLNEVAPAYYEAKADGDDDRASELADEVYGGMWGLGGGKGRVVFPIDEWNVEGGAYDEYVVKLATPHEKDEWDGRAQNRHEACVWDTTESDHLVPVVASDPKGHWLVMPRGDEIEQRDPDFWDWQRTVEYDLRDHVWREDVRQDNAVRLAGEYRLCDYGVAVPA